MTPLKDLILKIPYTTRNFLKIFLRAVIPHAEKNGINVPIRVDHVPALVGENPEMMGYAALGRLFAIGYMRGIIEMEGKNYG